VDGTRIIRLPRSAGMTSWRLFLVGLIVCLARANIGLVANLESLAIASAVAFSSGRAFLKGWPNHGVEVTFTRDVVISAENSEMATGCETAAAAP
jgi:hypothetical protein